MRPEDFWSRALAYAIWFILLCLVILGLPHLLESWAWVKIPLLSVLCGVLVTAIKVYSDD